MQSVVVLRPIGRRAASQWYIAFPHTRHLKILHTMHYRALASALICVCFMPLCPAAIAQAAPDSIARASPLPLRNLQIEVRQVQHEDSQRAGLETHGGVRVNPDDSAAVTGQVRAQDTQARRSGKAVQQVLVLNGRSARIALRTDTPLRLMQTFVRNGVLLVTQGTVLLQTGTGFMATPRWDGSDRVELEIAAQQTIHRSTAGIGQPLSSTASVLVLPLGEWMTVAQSEQQMSDTRSGLGGTVNQASQTNTDVQVRLTVR